MPRLNFLILAFCLQFASLLSAQPQNSYLPGKFVRADLVTPNLTVSKTFYAELFGWEFKIFPNYAIAQINERELGRIFQREPPKGSPSRAFWLAYMSVPDVAASQNIVTANGGSVLLPTRDVPALGKLAVFKDAEGAVFGTIRLNAGDPEDYLAEAGEWIWLQLLSRDSRKAADFYAKLAKYELIDNPLSDREDSYLLASNGYARAALGGVAATHTKNQQPTWLPFVRVENIAESIRKAEKLGGKVIVFRRDDLLDGRVAVLADPTGAAIGILEWQPENNAEQQP
jgi:predicted enzyme related to lactoylglutathione lyase